MTICLLAQDWVCSVIEGPRPRLVGRGLLIFVSFPFAFHQHFRLCVVEFQDVGKLQTRSDDGGTCRRVGILQLWFCVWTTCTIHSGTFGTSFQTKPFARCFHGWAGVSFGIRGGRNCTNIELWIERQWVKYWGRKRPPKLLYKKWQPRKKKIRIVQFFWHFKTDELLERTCLWSPDRRNCWVAKASACDTDFVEAAAAAVEEAELRRPVDSQEPPMNSR